LRMGTTDGQSQWLLGQNVGIRGDNQHHRMFKQNLIEWQNIFYTYKNIQNGQKIKK
jgi:hypothetical protein